MTRALSHLAMNGLWQSRANMLQSYQKPGTNRARCFREWQIIFDLNAGLEQAFYESA